MNIPYSPVGGVNSEDDPAGLNTEVVDSSNFLYERGMYITRPANTSLDLTIHQDSMAAFNPGSILEYAKSLERDNVFETIAIVKTPASGSQAWEMDDTYAMTHLGAVAALSDEEHHNIVASGGYVFIFNNPGTLFQVKPTFDTIDPGAYRYGTSHILRLVGAYSLATGNEDPRKIGWTRNDDVTDWVDTDFGAGSTILTDAPDGITALGNIKNVLVVGRPGGFHLGFATGNTTPAFRFESWSRDGEGVRYPSTFTVDSNRAYFVGDENVHIFDLNQVISIGDPIRRELFLHLQDGIRFRGFVSRRHFNIPRKWYHLVPYNATGPNVPHFIYDIKENKWSKHHYNYTPHGGFWHRRADKIDRVAICSSVLSESATMPIGLWNRTHPQATTDQAFLEREAWLLGKQILAGSPETNASLTRVLMQYRGRCRDTSMSVETSFLQGNVEIAKKNFQPGGTYVTDKWERKWFDNIGVGQYFQYRVKVPAGYSFEGNYIGGQYESAGPYVERVE